MRLTLNIDKSWKFARGDAADCEKDYGYGLLGKPLAKAGESAPPLTAGFDDKEWRTVDLPHDYAVESGFVETDNDNDKDHGYRPVLRHFPANSIGWYRKRFTVDSSWDGKTVTLRFEGMYRDSQIWVNGIYLGRHESGYTGLDCDIGDLLLYGGENLLTVRTDASQPEGWFYEGAGIYRHVYIIVQDALHIAAAGGCKLIPRVTTGGSGRLDAEVTIRNDSDDDRSAVLSLSAGGGTSEKQFRAAANSDMTVKISLDIEQLRLWSTDDPELYETTAAIKENGDIIDDETAYTGFRTIRFDANEGFFLNGRRTEIRGVCCHQDHAGVGAAVPDALTELRLRKLKEMGANAYRCSHNPPAPVLLDICDRLGILVMDENRLLSSGFEYRRQLESLVKRDRNHACVILWSIGNEEGGVQDGEIGLRTAKTLKKIVRSLDDTRPVTFGGNDSDAFEGVNSVVDVRGWNYIHNGEPAAVDRYHAAHPEQPMIGTEEGSTLGTRGEYREDPEKGYVCCDGSSKPAWGTTPQEWWSFYSERPFLAGAFVWTGFDYRGEPTPYAWPDISSHFGIMDTCGFPKDIYYYYRAMWTNEPVLHVFPNWSLGLREGTPVKVKCFTNCVSVELFVNGSSCGKKTREKYGHIEWTVPYREGNLSAVGETQDKRTVSFVSRTVRETAKLDITRESCADRDGIISLFTIRAADDQGNTDDNCAAGVSFEVTGEGAKIIGVGSGDPSCHEDDICPDGSWHRSLFHGLCSVIVRHPGDAGLTARLPDGRTFTYKNPD